MLYVHVNHHWFQPNFLSSIWLANLMYSLTSLLFFYIHYYTIAIDFTLSIIFCFSFWDIYLLLFSLSEDLPSLLYNIRSSTLIFEFFKKTSVKSQGLFEKYWKNSFSKDKIKPQLLNFDNEISHLEYSKIF